VIAAPDGRVYINTTGCNALAKAGSGDVLAGIIAALIAQGAEPFFAAVLAAHIHGKCGEEAADDLSAYGVTASDLCGYIPVVMKKINEQAHSQTKF
ncbi:MAG: bifunctional ADP-dependent NAD(P)H-hydrate dehydratase/NAD(P)H-hydrate epimerase, partial [Defluviitaleaceae bacterium]|nr:bifunctional ADP-dependent NAD(P)H-hydrate dehydratase/NAD(P)H-hydrate epimerase [Defluviitaleaceae bacterium]